MGLRLQSLREICRWQMHLSYEKHLRPYVLKPAAVIALIAFIDFKTAPLFRIFQIGISLGIDSPQTVT